MTIKPSGLNDRFIEPNGSFEEHIAITREIIKQTRVDLNQANADEIINYNLPFELVPKNPNKTAILCLHGTADSPSTMHDLATHFCQLGYLVRAPLFPGNGTIVADQTHLQLDDWVKMLNYHVTEMRKQADKLIIYGFCSGATLGLYAVLQQLPIDALILISPNVGFNKNLTENITQLQNMP